MLTTARLELRCAVLEDAVFLLRLLNEPSWLENIGDRGVRSCADAERYIRDAIQVPYRSLGYGMYVVQLKASRQPIGVCGLVRRDLLPGPDLGVALLPEFVGHGFATEAAHAVMEHAQHTLGIARLYALVKPGNERSVKLLGRLGFRHRGSPAIPQADAVEVYVTR